MLEVFISPLLQVVLEKLATSGMKLYQKKKNQKQITETIKKWQLKLGEIECILSDAEQQQFHDKVVKKWLQDLQHWAYDVEDILDEFVTEARLQELNHDEPMQENYSHISCLPMNKVPRIFTCASRTSHLHREKYYTTKIEGISIGLQEILDRVGALNLVRQTRSKGERQEERVETSCLERVVNGREEEKHKVIRLLLEDDLFCEKYVVIPIVGQGGIGKTTLAQSVYNDEQVKAHFAVRSWVCVSDVFSVKQISTAIINSVTHDTCSFNDLNGAQEILQQCLERKRFLIVLDDVWNEEYDPWDQLQLPFQVASKGSRIIVTTRIEKVARNMLTKSTQSPIVFLKGLPDDDCWNLFKQHALVDDNPIELRSEVVRLCKGLPLAAKALGGLLRKEDKTRWARILNSNMWLEEGGVLPVLRLSYLHLPQHLKRIFAYCSIFPKDHEFGLKNTVQMWMAEGFLPSNVLESMEDHGANYFFDLVSRSLFEASPSDKSYFIMHDLIHDLAQWAAGEVSCQLDCLEVSCRTRFLSLTEQVMQRDPSLLHKVGEKGGQLRTFAFFGRIEFNGSPLQIMLESIFQQFQYLRVMSLAKMSFTELPISVGDLKHLRFLDLSFNDHIIELPESTSKLCNLQTLLLKECKNLRKVVSDMALLIELRHLDIDGTKLLEMPVGIGRLTNIQTLNPFFLTRNSGGKISDLEKLNCIRSLDISGLRYVTRKEDAQKARLHEKSSLDVLKMFWPSWNSKTWLPMVWDTRDTQREYTEGVENMNACDLLQQLQPPQSVKELHLYGYMGLNFPDWFENISFNEMVIIKLEGCLSCKCLPPFGQLPSLKELSMKYMDNVNIIGSEFYGVGCSNPFPVLKILQFDELKSWEEWCPSIVNVKAFSLLEDLEIFRCPLLRGSFPSHLPSLKKLNIEGCKELRVSLPSVPLLQQLTIRCCSELSSRSSIISCSDYIMLENITQFSGFEGFWVEGIRALVVVDVTYLEIGYGTNCILLFNCPKLPSWWPSVYGTLDKLTEVALGNYEPLALFLEDKFPSSVKHLTIEGEESKSLRHISKITNRSTCLEELHIGNCLSPITVNNLPSTLKTLKISNVIIEQPPRQWEFHLLTSLQFLTLENIGSYADSIERIPGPDFSLPSSLTKLVVIGFGNLKTMSCSNLPNLLSIFVQNCPLTEEPIEWPDHFRVRTRFGRRGRYISGYKLCPVCEESSYYGCACYRKLPFDS